MAVQWPERKSTVPQWTANKCHAGDTETPVRMFNKAQEMRKNCMNSEQERQNEKKRDGKRETERDSARI